MQGSKCQMQGMFLHMFIDDGKCVSAPTAKPNILQK
jgi:hypothetical protein